MDFGGAVDEGACDELFDDHCLDAFLAPEPQVPADEIVCLGVECPLNERQKVTDFFRERKNAEIMVSGGQDPFVGKLFPSPSSIASWFTRYIKVDLRVLAGYLKQAGITNGNLPCPSMIKGSPDRCNGTLESKEILYTRIKKVYNIDTVDFVLLVKYQCTSCGHCCNSASPDLHALLRDLGLGFALDQFPYTFTSRGGIATPVLDRLTMLVVHGVPVQVSNWIMSACR